MHGGSGNHGCEAIVRSLSAILDEKVTIFSKHKEEDHKYIGGINKMCFKKIGPSIKELGVLGYPLRFRIKYLHQKYAFVKPTYKYLLKNANSNSIAFSIGGDNYCYDGLPEVLSILNKRLNKKGTKTVLYGCSIEPNLLQDVSVVEDLKRYALIVPRESITYHALVQAGLGEKTILASDPAFTLETKVNDDAVELIGTNTIGINLSPLVLEGNNTILFEAYCRLIEWIISSTDMEIALIPHVVWKGNDDRIPLGTLYEKYKESKRIMLLEDYNATELKGYISKCRFFVGARTHATIAAYSSSVPTLVAGYSVKSIGIARDIFGTDEGYVVNTKGIETDKVLVNAFKRIYENEKSIRTHLIEKMPEYIKAAYAANDVLKTL